MMAAVLESGGTLLAVLTPLVAVPLTVITFYLRSLREHQVTWHSELVRRFETVEASVTDVRKIVAEFERDYTSKEEWLRECMHARRTLEQLKETSVRLDATMGNVISTAYAERGADRGRAGRVEDNSLRPGTIRAEHEDCE